MANTVHQNLMSKLFPVSLSLSTTRTMASSASLQCSYSAIVSQPPKDVRWPCRNRSFTVSLRSLPSKNPNRFPRHSIRSSFVSAEGLAPAVALTDNALKHLNKMRSEQSEDLCLRIGVKQGGCSGMSYTMEFESRTNTRPDDSVIEYDGFTIVCDPKSLLFIFGMQLDYSDALIGGGFSFKNPNATQTCGCGKSFAAEM